MSEFPDSPFGTIITDTQVVATMATLHGWEDRYRQVVMWGKQLPKMDEGHKQATVKIAGCESQVWLLAACDENGIWRFHADSDARIVRGLIAIVFAALNHKNTQQIQSIDIEAYFEQLGLLNHLSASRGNGLRAIVDTIRQSVA
ncbi:cysteine desulfurase sulfur acceptor subunit CsdE [Vibrio palustris]|uniref:Sulfur acceptor protein CsdE n=1 Tax=Vibrio palustris TaxID=1918946 RepID=A0A1R4AZU8_9VIBR|nr:cysteine desulfurase sulfur acceptor subunit CsdE [Vibrio palustris]SJL82195.1 Sulfur acceptor protein CsdE [Vibrio palustris]